MMLAIKSIAAMVLVLATAALAAPGNINRGETLTIDMGAPLPTTFLTDSGPPPPEPTTAQPPEDIWGIWAELLKFRESAKHRRRHNRADSASPSFELDG
ncbi:hypothetical protein LEL_07094 [Akanthomyces lecanii RCEF 1005]|uniref:Uncharacterized protein n=1 Tax=Akanthomyces lecanii RCEF 1005 TaxID=1081108 RepID=A0A168FFA8_CORDF|nr:hypothetical protein LEL_07094 [Akanthomyces lecanii RCEF 1005]